MSVNWYLGDGIKSYSVNPYQDISKIKRVQSLEKSKLNPKMSSLISYMNNFDHKLHEYHHTDNHVKTPPENHQSVMAKVIMSSPPITLPHDTKIPDAIDYIQKYHHHHFPIVDQDNRMVGLVTDRDFLRNTPSTAHNSPSEKGHVKDDTVASLMSTKLLIAQETTSAYDIGKVMLQDKIKCVPILDDQLKLKGIITSSDLIRSIIEHPFIDRNA